MVARRRLLGVVERAGHAVATPPFDAQQHAEDFGLRGAEVVYSLGGGRRDGQRRRERAAALFLMLAAVAAVAGRVLNARSARRVLKGARAPGEPSAAAAGVGRAGLVLNGAAPPGAALASAAGASRLIGGAECRAARAAARPNMGHDRFWSAYACRRLLCGLRKALVLLSF